MNNIYTNLFSLFFDIAFFLKNKFNLSKISLSQFSSYISNLSIDNIGQILNPNISTLTYNNNNIISISSRANISYIFQYQSKIQLNFPNCITIGNFAFFYYDFLTSIDCFNCTTIESNAFAHCTNLTSINFPNCITTAQNAFNNCINLNTITLPNCTTIGQQAFKDCIQLTTVILPKCTEILSSAFYGCTSLKSIYLNNSNVCTLENNVFASTLIYYSNGSIFVPTSLINTYKSAINWSYYADKIFAIEDYPPPSD